jgi:hypothetical protein
MKSGGRIGRKAAAAERRQQHVQDSDPAGKSFFRDDQQIV